MKKLNRLVLVGLLALNLGLGFRTFANGNSCDGLVKLTNGGSVTIRNQNKLFEALANNDDLQVEFKKLSFEDGKVYEFDVAQDGNRLIVGLNKLG